MDNLLEYIKSEYKLDCKLRFLLNRYSANEIVARIIELLARDRPDTEEIISFARDFCIGSDLKKTEKNNFYKQLKKQGFFTVLNLFVSASNFGLCSSTINNIGKFSKAENAVLLENVYEKQYKNKSVLLSYKCLSELSWLGSEKVASYLSELESEKTIISNLVLLYYCLRCGSDSDLERLLQNDALMQFIHPTASFVNLEHETETRLWGLELYFLKDFGSMELSMLTNSDFKTIAKDYFTNFTGN